MKKLFSLISLLLSLQVLGVNLSFTIPPNGATSYSPTQVAGMVLWWNAKNLTLSGSSITGATDLSGNGRNLAPLSTNPTYNATAMNGFPTAQFDGSQNNLGVIGIGGARTTMSWWALVNPTTFATFNALFYLPSTTSSWLLATNDIYLENGGVQKSLDYWVNAVGARAGTGAFFQNGVTAEISGDYNGSTLHIYYNNDTSPDGTGSATGQFGDRISIGGLKPGYAGENWTGNISEFALFNRVISNSDRNILTQYLQHNWFPLWANELRSFYFDGTTHLDGGTSFVNYDYTQALTYCGWARPAAGQTIKVSFFGREQSGAGFRGFDMLRELSGKISLYQAHDFGANNYLYAFSTGTIPADGIAWSFVCATMDGTGTAAGTKFYINGASAGPTTNTSDTLTATIVDPTSNGFVGDAYGTTNWFGDLDEMTIFTATLSAGDISTLYHKGLPYDITGFHDLVHWYRMGEANDNINTIHDQVGSINLTSAGTPKITTAIPLPLLYAQ